MKRLDDETLSAFIGERGYGLMLFGSHHGRPTLAQARVFADIWADRHSDMRFGYIDALCCEAAKKRYSVRLLPTLLVLRDGRIIAKLEGFHDHSRLAAALEARASDLAQAA